MFVMVRNENNPREQWRLFGAGVVMVAVVFAFLGLAVAVYAKVFTTFTTVTLQADRAGLQLPKNGDVRYNGALVGSIRDISQTGDTAVITLGLEPESAKQMPADIEASIFPTTLFGQKYVALSGVEGSSGVGLRSGTVLPPERVHTTVELGQVLSRLFPLLETVQPSDLAATLNALATALNGRGAKMGETLDTLDSYLTDMNEHLPTLQEDLKLLGSVARTYDIAAPDLVATLGNLTVTSRTITSKKREFSTLFGEVAGLSDAGSRLMEDNETDIIRAVNGSESTLRMMAKYAPEYECLLRGIAVYKPILIKTFSGGEVKQYAEFPSKQHRGYDRRDIPEYKETRGPGCFGLPNNPPIPWPGLDLRNGTDMDTERGRGDTYTPPGGEPPPPNILQDLIEGFPGQNAAYGGPSSTRSGRQATNALLSTRTGQPVDKIPALATLMYSPFTTGSGDAA